MIGRDPTHLQRLRQVVMRLQSGDYHVRADEQRGPVEIRLLARAINALIGQAGAEALAEKEAEHFRQRSRLISGALRRTTSGSQMAERLVTGIGQAFEVDRVWLHLVPDGRITGAIAQWHRDDLADLPQLPGERVETMMQLANRLWIDAQVLAIDDHRSMEERRPGDSFLDLAPKGPAASLVVPVGDSITTFGMLWLSMADHPRHWSHTEFGLLQHLATELAQSLVQSSIIERQERAADLLRELDQARADFLTTVSSELRTPLSSITGYLEMLRGGEAGDIPGSAQEMLLVIERNANRLSNLVEDLLMRSRIDVDRTSPERETVEISALLNDVRSSLLPMATAAQVTVHPIDRAGADLRLSGEANQLEQAFGNVLDNAIKFARPGDSVHVLAGVDDDSDGIFVQVSDTGIGIPADELPMVFDKYYRASNATSAGIPGNGLGLALVREVVDGHCGDLDVESLPEGGTTVTLWLPRHPPLQDSTPR